MWFQKLPSESARQQRLLPNVIDEISIHDPSRVFAVIPGFENHEDYIHVTYRNFAKAIDRMAWWMKRKLAKRTGFGAVAYMGPADIGYQIVTVAACKIGVKVS